MKVQPGDKVRLKVAPYLGTRGVVERSHGSHLLVRLDSNGDVVRVTLTDVTNYSLAARKAWESMPDRRVGRPKGSTTSDRISVTLRIDRSLWDRFRRAEAAALIGDRTESINAWISERLDELEGGIRPTAH